MKNYLIVTDSTSAMDLVSAYKYDIKLVPLSVIIDGKEYKDHYEIKKEELYDVIREGKVPTTSQPSVGYVEELMLEWSKENYDAIIIIAVSSGLSGTFQSFNMAKQELNLNNVHIIDSRSVGAPLLDAAIEAKKMADEDHELDEILTMIEKKFNHTYSFLYPETLTQLKKGGRLSPAVANLAKLLKIKPLLYLANHGEVVDKYGIARTDGKIIQMVIDQFEKENIQTDTHKIYILQADNMKAAHLFEEKLKAHFDNIEIEIVNLPAVLTCHGGVGCIAIQSTLIK